MAKFDGKFIRGIVGKAIFREINGQQIVQGITQKPKISRSKNTIKASSIFGDASCLGGYIRRAFDDLTRDDYDSYMSSRFAAEVNYCLRAAAVPNTELFDFQPTTFNRLIGFEFNTKSKVRDLFFAQPQISFNQNELLVVIPELNLVEDLTFPQRIKKCKLILSHTLLDTTNGFFKETEHAVLNLAYDMNNPIIPSQGVVFGLQPGCLSVLTIALRYIENTFVGENSINNRNFNPVAILSAHYIGGIPNKSETETWHYMKFKNPIGTMLPPPAT
ncbi:MAG: hypothetical protein EOO92_15400 [Pedobacter sp.]|nr:MAG: hypothetical protein EOO92_15400 [Pedobacter sp.]